MSELKDYWIPTRSDNVCHCYLILKLTLDSKEALAT